jgi:hypothetical protein
VMTFAGSAPKRTLTNGTMPSRYSTTMDTKSLTPLTKSSSGSRYYMDQHRMIETILEEENINGTKDEHLCTIPQLDATTQTTIQAILIRSNGGGFPETEIYRDKTAILTAEKGENRKKTVYFF